MVAVIFRDKEIQARFDRDGYVVFDFIDTPQADLIAEKFYKLHHQIPGGFYSVASVTDEGFKKEMSDHAENVISDKMEQVFVDYKKLGTTFLSKAPGKEGRVPVHRDWMVVDESKYFSGTIWVPLIDVSEANGAMRFLPGSHKFFKDLRSSTLPSAFEGYEQEIWDQMVTVPMKAGQALLLNHAVIHASTLNLTDKERLVLVCGVIPAGAKLSYYHNLGNGRVEKLEMPDDMFMRHSNVSGRPSFGVKVDEFEYKFKPENRLRIQQLITTAKAERMRVPFFQNEEQDHNFAEKGYLKMPLLNDAEVESFTEALQEQDNDVIQQVSLAEKIEQLVCNKITLSAGKAKIIDIKLDVRRKNSLEPEYINQELSYVDDEDVRTSVTCWIPLADVSIDTGTWAFITGSHLFLGNKCQSQQPQGAFTFNGNELDIFPYLQTIDLKAGEALIFDHRIFKTHLPNTGSKNVLALSIKLAHSQSELLDSLPEIDKSVNKRGPEFSTVELLDLIKANGGSVNKPLVEHLMKMDSYRNYIAEKEQIKEAVIQDTGLITSPVMPGISISEASKVKSFWSTYSPLNIAREIKKRVLG